MPLKALRSTRFSSLLPSTLCCDASISSVYLFQCRYLGFLSTWLDLFLFISLKSTESLIFMVFDTLIDDWIALDDILRNPFLLCFKECFGESGVMSFPVHKCFLCFFEHYRCKSFFVRHFILHDLNIATYLLQIYVIRLVKSNVHISWSIQ